MDEETEKTYYQFQEARRLVPMVLDVICKEKPELEVASFVCMAAAAVIISRINPGFVKSAPDTLKRLIEQEIRFDAKGQA